MISGFSVLSALFIYSLSLIPVCLMRRSTKFLEKGGTSALLLAFAFATARLILPFEMPATFAIRSWNLLGVPLKFFRTYPTVTRLLLAVWGIGAIVVTRNDVVDLYRAHKQCDGYDIEEREHVQEVAERLCIPCPVLVTPSTEIPYVAGIFRYKIYIPDVELPEEELEFILAHEGQHVRSHDALIKLVFGIMSALMWWNPIAHWSRREINALLELRCDARVTKDMDELKRVRYAVMLKNMAKRVVSGRRMPVLALDESFAVGQPNLLDQRVRVIASRDYKPPRFVRTAVQFVVLAAVFCLSYLVIFQAVVPPPDEYIPNNLKTDYEENYNGFVFDEGLGSAFIMKDPDGQYRLFIDYRFDRYLTTEEVASSQYKDLFIFERDE